MGNSSSSRGGIHCAAIRALKKSSPRSRRSQIDCGGRRAACIVFSSRHGCLYSWAEEELPTMASSFLLRLYHRHEPVFDRGGGLGRAQAQRKRFMQRVAFRNKFFALFTEFLAGFFELLQ